MNNPDERTAVDQFGKGDKYFGICTLMATLPGLPMFGHGQLEGFNEKYGMEYRRSYHDETPDAWLVARHEREISPLLHRRALFAEAHDFRLYDFFTDEGWVSEDVFAYSNRHGAERALVVYHNRYATTRGWIRMSCAFADRAGGGLRQTPLGEALGLSPDPSHLVAFRDARTGLEHLHRAGDLAGRGLRLELQAYQCHVFLDWRDEAVSRVCTGGFPAIHTGNLYLKGVPVAEDKKGCGNVVPGGKAYETGGKRQGGWRAGRCTAATLLRIRRRNCSNGTGLQCQHKQAEQGPPANCTRV